MNLDEQLDSLPLTLLQGGQATFAQLRGKVTLVVNVASRCGFSKQYAELEGLQREYGERGLVVIGAPSNQFLQELADDAAIAEYCSTTWGITFPMLTKIKLNGKNAHPLFKVLTQIPDAGGKAGKVKWNFEKFVLTPVAAQRFRSAVSPQDSVVVDLIEAGLAD